MAKIRMFWLMLLISVVPGRLAFTQAASTKAGIPPQQFVIEVELPAPVSEVCHAFASSEGLSSWLFPNATVDLKPGCVWLVFFSGCNTGGGTIVSFVLVWVLV